MKAIGKVRTTSQRRRSLLNLLEKTDILFNSEDIFLQFIFLGIKTAAAATEASREGEQKEEDSARRGRGKRIRGEKDLAMLLVRLKQCVARIIELSILDCM